MAENTQRYWLEFSSRAHKNVSVEAKHTALFDSLKHLPEPWGPGSRPIPPVPEFGNDNIVAICPLAQFLGVPEGDIIYQYRWAFPDDGLYDDRIIVIFRTSEVDLRDLAYTVIPVYIQAFDAYRVECFDDELVDSLADQPKRRQDPRFSIDRIDPISFFDDLLCQRAFGVGASTVVDAFDGRIEHAAEMHNGAYLVGSSERMSFKESRELSRDMMQMLGPQRRW